MVLDEAAGKAGGLYRFHDAIAGAHADGPVLEHLRPCAIVRDVRVWLMAIIDDISHRTFAFASSPSGIQNEPRAQ